MLLPQARRELSDVGRGVAVVALLDIDKVVVGVDVLQTAGGDQALDDADMPGTEFCPTEHPVFPALGNRTERAFEVVGVDRDIRVGQEDFE